MTELQRMIKALALLTLILTFFIIISSNAVAINAGMREFHRGAARKSASSNNAKG